MPPADDPAVAETPLHWAASANDVAAVDALVAAGADVDALGGIFGGCTPYEEAIIFENYDAARRLLAAGATNYLPGAAALGDDALIDQFFDAAGEVRLDVGVLPHWSVVPPKKIILDRAFQFACRAGHLGIAKHLLRRGADLDALTPTNSSALDEAVENNHADVVDWLTSLHAG
jgi:ankyrin repeat protein